MAAAAAAAAGAAAAVDRQVLAGARTGAACLVEAAGRGGWGRVAGRYQQDLAPGRTAAVTAAMAAAGAAAGRSAGCAGHCAAPPRRRLPLRRLPPRRPQPPQAPHPAAGHWTPDMRSRTADPLVVAAEAEAEAAAPQPLLAAWPVRLDSRLVPRLAHAVSLPAPWAAVHRGALRASGRVPVGRPDPGRDRRKDSCVWAAGVRTPCAPSPAQHQQELAASAPPAAPLAAWTGETGAPNAVRRHAWKARGSRLMAAGASCAPLLRPLPLQLRRP